MKIREPVSLKFFMILLFANSVSAASVDGVPLHSSISGTGHRAVILVHGWTCDETSWESQVPALSRNYRTITLDLPGHGQSGSPADGELSMDLFARAIEAVRSETAADPVALVGHSMGTPVIIQYARLYPQHTLGLVFVDGPVALPRNLPPAELFAGPDGLKEREKLIRSMFSQSTTPQMQEHILSMMLSAPEATAVGAMRAARNPALWQADVFMQPVLGLYADGSTMAEREYMQARFPNLEYFQFSGTGHFLMLEQPEQFNRVLLAFLDKLEY